MATTQAKIKAKVTTVMNGVQVREGKRGKTIRFCCMIEGHRFQETYEKVPAELLLEKNDKPTRLLKDAYNEWYDDCARRIGRRGAIVCHEPTLGEILEKYRELAEARNRDPRFLKPAMSTINNNCKNFEYLVRFAGLSMNDKYWKLYDHDTLTDLFDALIERMEGTSAWTYVSCVTSVAPRWALPYYEKAGFQIKIPAMPDVGNARKSKRYDRPSKEELDKQDLFYASLQDEEDKRLFLLGSMVLHLAMRPCDVGRLTMDNFFEGSDGRMYLSYTPIKTMHSSGRSVTWPIPKALWEQIMDYAGDRLKDGGLLVPNWVEVGRRLNKKMNAACEMKTFKKLYEWRKRCIDYVYHHYGINAATAISGDAAETIQYYYFDPKMDLAAPTFETIPIRARA